MDQITTAEKKTLNQVSQQRDPDVKLGDILSALIGESIVEGTPVNPVKATETLNITGVVVDGETVSIGDDVYEFCAAADQRVALGNIPVDIEANAGKATGTLTMDTQPTSGDKVTIGTKVYTFVPIGTDTADGEVSIGADLAEAKLNLVAAINGADEFNEPHPLVSAAAFVGDDCVITALVGGVAGNTIATTETFTAVTNVFAAVTLLTGTDCTAANAITALVAAITAEDTQGVGAVDGAGDTVVLTADVAGIAGNEIALAETLANGTFVAGATELSGGVDGTDPNGKVLLHDDTYLYVCIDGINWRRIALGNAF